MLTLRSNCSKCSNRSKRFERLEQLERFEPVCYPLTMRLLLLNSNSIVRFPRRRIIQATGLRVF